MGGLVIRKIWREDLPYTMVELVFLMRDVATGIHPQGDTRITGQVRTCATGVIEWKDTGWQGTKR